MHGVPGMTVLLLGFLLGQAHAAPLDVSDDLAVIVQEHAVPGLVAAAIVEGEWAAQGAAGLRKSDAPEQVKMEDAFHIGSCTKSMTATLAAMLVEDQVLTWQTTLKDVFPEMPMHEDYQKVTLQQLVTNTAGVPRAFPTDLWNQAREAKGTSRAQRLELVRGLLSRAPAHVPGTTYEYSNGGFTVAGAMLEEKTGESYESLLQRRLFVPLGMTRAGFGAPASPGLVDEPYGHRRKGEGWVPVAPLPYGDNPEAISPAGRVHCPMGDLVRYTQFHMGVRGQPLLKPEALTGLHTPTAIHPYAAGWVVTKRGWAHGPVLTHTGSNTMFFTVIWMAPEDRFAVLACCNVGGDVGAKACDAAVAGLIQRFR